MHLLLAIILIVANTAWLVLDVLGLPGNWLIVAGTLVVAWIERDRHMFSPWTLVAVVTLAAAGEVLELISGLLGAKKGGASRRASLGALAGGMVGAIVGTFAIPVPVIGSLIGACAGACLAAWGVEAHRGRDPQASLRAGVGAGLGQAVGTILKLAIGIILWAIVAIAALWP